MKYIPLFLLSTALLAQEAPPTPTTTTAAAMTESKSILVIEPKSRANDYIQAFDMLRKDKPTLKIAIHIGGGTMLENVTEVATVKNGTLLMIKYASSSGTKYQVVPIEEIAEMSYSS
ncbi:MAG TPA: hypothetical protein VLE89_08170 [Chlamydiales bacterium]|nr:hypothetical protein [Chlamydiales bacterium]